MSAAIPVPDLNVADPTREAGNDFGEEYVGVDEPPIDDEPDQSAAFHSLADVLRTRKPRRPIATGITKLDELTNGGLSPGESAIFASGPGGLKTTALMNIAETMALPNTAICVVAWDERWTTVAAKLGGRFGEPYASLNSEHPETLLSLERRLERREVFVQFVDPASAMPFEDISATFDRIAPKGRVRIYVVDLLQLMETRTIDERDTEVIALKKLVEALLRVNRVQESILLVASETTKASISLEAVEANPLGVFAGSRKMASRFDLPIAMAKVDDLTVKVFVAKNRLGPTDTFLLRLDPTTWGVKSIDDEEVRAVADSVGIKKRKAFGKEILRILPAATLPGISRRRISDALKARNVRFGTSELGPAVELLFQAGFIVQDDGPRNSLLAKLAIGIDPESPRVKAW